MRLRVKRFILLSAVTVAAHNLHAHDISRRKSLGFGPILSHASYTTYPDPRPVTVSSLLADPFQVAEEFVQSLVPPNGRASYVIREDSYTDDRTGVTHVYVKQVIDGLEVADGKMNLNIRNGHVLSYGDSFYRGDLSDHKLTLPRIPSPHVTFCETLLPQLNAQRHLVAQSPFQTQDRQQRASTLLREHVYRSHCDFLARGLDVQGSPDDPRAAALLFIIAATPSSSLADDISAKLDEYLSSVTLTPSYDYHGTLGREFTLGGVPDTVNPVIARLVYAQVPVEDTVVLRLAWKLVVEMQDNWYEATVDTYQPSRILAVVDWATDSPIQMDRFAEGATYNVFKFGVNDPSEEERSLEKENFDSLASPLGWHSVPIKNIPLQSDSLGELVVTYTSTAGNNVFAHEHWDGGDGWLYSYRPNAGMDRIFDYPYGVTTLDDSEPLEIAKSFINASITQLFYTTNMIHDLFYRYGFDEKSGNFQQSNFGRGGKEGDAIIASGQDGGAFNNANFMTPPDGYHGRCRMYLWDTAKPYRDGDLDAGIVIHELTHGLSSRLTGGSDDSGCLGWGESTGLGEGWGDFMASLVRNKGVDQEYPMGAWASNKPEGIRAYLYSADKEVNPTTYGILNEPEYFGTHATGEVWAEILWVTAQVLIKKHGLSDTLFPPKPDADGNVPTGDFYRTKQHKDEPLVPIHGNTLMMQLVIEGMKLQPCWPDFLDARDSIIFADNVLTGGENECALWEGFASRGLGLNATYRGARPWGGGVRTNDFSLPMNCAT